MKTLYRAARVRTQAYPEAAAWLLVDGRHVRRVGAGDPPDADRIVDLPGATIVPGFIDAHVHLTETGLALGSEDVRDTRSAGDLLDVVRRRAGGGDRPLLLLGYDESAWPDAGLPTLDALDSACARPLVIRRTDGHASLANTAALEASGVLELPGVERDPAGVATGMITQQANSVLGLWVMSAVDDHERQNLQLQAASLAASRGITSVHEMSMPHWNGEHDLRVLLDHRGRLPVDAVPSVATTDLGLAIGHGLTAIGGDLPVDGSIGARSAWLSEPYTDGGTGVAYFADDELAEFFHGGHVAGLQVGVHAIGDLAIHQVLSVWERVYHALDSRERRHFRARRHRVEHIEMISTAQVERAAMLGLAASVQPAFDRTWGGPGGLYERRLGHERASTMNPFRTLVERGIEVGSRLGRSDHRARPDARVGTHGRERHHRSSGAASVTFEAIRLHTMDRLASVTKRVRREAWRRQHADFAAFDGGPVRRADARGFAPVLTVSLGREVFVAESPRPRGTLSLFLAQRLTLGSLGRRSVRAAPPPRRRRTRVRAAE